MPRVETRLSKEEKLAWQVFCRSGGVSEAEMLRMMIRHVAVSEVGTLKEVKSCQVNIRLSEYSIKALIDRVEKEGYSTLAGWVRAVVLATLFREPVLTEEEIIALRESNREIAAIGRNLNQIARSLNVEFREADKIKFEFIQSLVQKIEINKSRVGDLLSRNIERWGDNE